MLNIHSCIIVGAGVSGLIAAHKLRQYDIEVTLIEKGRGFGGRMATKVWDDAIFDHGAQFMTTREKVFRDLVQSWKTAGIVQPWYVGPLGNMRFVGVKGITTVAEYLAKGLSVIHSQKVVSTQRKKDRWVVKTEQQDTGEKQTYEADFLILTAPVPQSLQLLAVSKVDLDYDEEEELKRIQYLKCITVMAKLNGPAGVPNPGAMDLNHPVLRFIGDNSAKGITTRIGSMTLHSSAQFAEKHWDTPDEERIPLMLTAAKPFLKSDVVEAKSHRWAYSEPTRIYKEKQPFRQPYFVDSDNRLAMCGDGFNGPRIEAAAMSGLALAERLVRPY